MGVESELATARSRSSVMGYGLWGLSSLSVRRYSVGGSNFAEARSRSQFG